MDTKPIETTDSIKINNIEMYIPSILDKIVRCIKINIKAKNINMNSVFDFIIRCMEILENYDNLSGEQKKQYIILAIQEILYNNTTDVYIDENIIKLLKNLLENNMLGNLIDTISNASKNNFNINKIKTKKCNNCIIM